MLSCVQFGAQKPGSRVHLSLQAENLTYNYSLVCRELRKKLIL